eukprot:3177530-Lingulodinium_polyedra.AAC.1
MSLATLAKRQELHESRSEDPAGVQKRRAKALEAPQPPAEDSPFVSRLDAMPIQDATLPPQETHPG